ncbi:MAG: TatD family deoxyribonuclease, partial [Peptococcaceae bacterium]
AAAGLVNILNVGYDLESARCSVALAADYDFVFAAAGVHPHEAAKVSPDYLEELKRLAAHPKLKALGEMGLDYYRNLSPKPVQQRVFREQLALARELNLPVIIHDRDAHGDTLELLRRDGAGRAGGVMHCFSGSWEMAEECVGLGFYISIAGPVTFASAARLKDIAARLPLERLLVETDAPYLTPVPYRGRRNEPANVRYVVEEVARLRGMPPEALGEALVENGRRLFGI